MITHSNSNPANRCPDCDAAITADDINIREGVALCPGCGALKRLGELSLTTRPVAEILAQPPAGCTAEPTGQGAHVVASLRSIGGFIVTLFFALFWNGIVSVFVVHALCGLYANLVGPLPAWFPALDAKNGVPRLNGAPMELSAPRSVSACSSCRSSSSEPQRCSPRSHTCSAASRW